LALMPDFRLSPRSDLQLMGPKWQAGVVRRREQVRHRQSAGLRLEVAEKRWPPFAIGANHRAKPMPRR